MVNYTLTFKQDVYTIINNEATPLTLVLTKVNDCTDDVVAEPVEILASASYEVPLKKDGIYSLKITNEALDEQVLSLKYYLSLQTAAIEDVYTAICTCDCGCADCVDLTKDAIAQLLVANTRMDVYIRLSSPRYDTYLKALNKETECLTVQQVYCDISEEGLTGLTKYNEILNKQLLAIKYLALYFNEEEGLTDEDDLNYLNTKFNKSSIFCCISKLGINIKEIEQLIKDTMGTITINAGAYVNQPPTVGDNTLATDNRTDYIFTMADFTTNTTPPYNDPEGVPADAVKFNSLPADGTIRLSSNPVNIGDIILKTDIDAGNLIYSPPDQDPVDSDTWTFSARDGDGLWSI